MRLTVRSPALSPSCRNPCSLRPWRQASPLACSSQTTGPTHTLWLRLAAPRRMSMYRPSGPQAQPGLRVCGPATHGGPCFRRSPRAPPRRSQSPGSRKNRMGRTPIFMSLRRAHPAVVWPLPLSRPNWRQCCVHPPSHRGALPAGSCRPFLLEQIYQLHHANNPSIVAFPPVSIRSGNETSSRADARIVSRASRSFLKRSSPNANPQTGPILEGL